MILHFNPSLSNAVCQHSLGRSPALFSRHNLWLLIDNPTLYVYVPQPEKDSSVARNPCRSNVIPCAWESLSEMRQASRMLLLLHVSVWQHWTGSDVKHLSCDSKLARNTSVKSWYYFWVSQWLIILACPVVVQVCICRQPFRFLGVATACFDLTSCGASMVLPFNTATDVAALHES